MWETWDPSLGWEDPLEKGNATHSSILAWRIPWTVVWGRKESDMAGDFHFHSDGTLYLLLIPGEDHFTAELGLFMKQLI